jgi:hypothetical protein
VINTNKCSIFIEYAVLTMLATCFVLNRPSSWQYYTEKTGNYICCLDDGLFRPKHVAKIVNKAYSINIVHLLVLHHYSLIKFNHHKNLNSKQSF